MERWEIVLLTGGVSLITAVLTSWVTTWLTRRNEVRKHIMEKRTEFYFEIFPVIDTLVNHVDNILHDEYWDEFMRLKAKMKLLASQETFKMYEKLFVLLAEAVSAFDIYTGIRRGEDTVNYDQESLAKIDRADFALSVPDFAMKHLPDKNLVRQYIQELYEAMRKDLGSNLK